MLSKLIKHEFIATSRFLLPLHILMLIVSIIGRFIVSAGTMTEIPMWLTPLLITSFIAFICIVAIVTTLIILMRFYRHLFTGEAYLTLTLPATAGQQLFSKVLVGSIWIIIDLISILATFSIIFINSKSLTHISKFVTEIDNRFEVNSLHLLVITFLLTFLSSIASLLVPYMCICIGQLFPTHRILGAIVIYFVIMSVTQVFVTAFMFSAELANVSSPGNLVDALSSAYFLGFILSILQIAISYTVSHMILKKKVNLN